jgi:hypothetical protein
VAAGFGVTEPSARKWLARFKAEGGRHPRREDPMRKIKTIAAAATGRTGGAFARAAIGAAGGAIVGGATAPRNPCPDGTFRDRFGNLYCR